MESVTASVTSRVPESKFPLMSSSTLFTAEEQIDVSVEGTSLIASNQTVLDVDSQGTPWKRQRNHRWPAGYQKLSSHPVLSGKGHDHCTRSSDISEGTSTSSRDNSTPIDSATSASHVSSNHLKRSRSPLFLNGITSSNSSPASKKAPGQTNTSRFRPRSSIPSRLPSAVYAQQCVAAAYASRLNPYALHKNEQEALQDKLCHLHVTTYLNIRNGILRLWLRNPLVSVTTEEALGCAKDYRWMYLASFAYEWLYRNGYINFGCLEIPAAVVPPKKGRRKDGPVVVIVGAGMAGLGCARHLEGLFRHYRDSDTSPRVILLEARRRIGGRIYSHLLRSPKSSTLPSGAVPKAEMGAQIIVGFENGNPLDQIIRGQLALPYHLLRDISTIYDIDGSPVDELRDSMNERLYNDVLDKSGRYRHKAVIVPTAEGDRELINNGRDLALDDGLTVRQYEDARAAGTVDLLVPTTRVRRGVSHKTAEAAPAAETSVAELGAEEEPSAAVVACQQMGWALKGSVAGSSGHSNSDNNGAINFDKVAYASTFQTLGAVMDDGVKQYQDMLPLTSKDMRLLNWHFANLEYANAATVGQLSLSGWDQDLGNEFEGEHAQVVGGYQQVPYGLYSLPSKLDVRTNKIVTKISYNPTAATRSNRRKTVVWCEDGESFVADTVIFTGSLGVLKHQSISFDPPLPEWKRGAIERLGFGLMNKVILVFNQPFWETERDMFGLLREPQNRNSMIQEEYATNRGRFYLFWNCMKTTGLPVLIALMAGEAAHQAEFLKDDQIIAEVLSQLRNVFKQVAVPDPLETIITRWGSDRFTRGSYSFVAAQALPGDYDLMAKPVGNLHFAGEATCGTHPATVHGAYLSGLRAASEVIDSIVGPIAMPSHGPLVPEKGQPTEFEFCAISLNSEEQRGRRRQDSSTSSTSIFYNLGILTPSLAASAAAAAAAAAAASGSETTIGAPSSTPASSPTSRETYEYAMWTEIFRELGRPAPRPARTGLNPFLLYQKDYWGKARVKCESAKRAAMMARTGDGSAMEGDNDDDVRAARDEIRHVLGQMWREADAEERKPYIEQTNINRQANAAIWERWKQAVAEWEKKACDMKDRWVAANPFESWRRQQQQQQQPEPPTRQENGTN